MPNWDLLDLTCKILFFSFEVWNSKVNLKIKFLETHKLNVFNWNKLNRQKKTIYNKLNKVQYLRVHECSSIAQQSQSCTWSGTYTWLCGYLSWSALLGTALTPVTRCWVLFEAQPQTSLPCCPPLATPTVNKTISRF